MIGPLAPQTEQHNAGTFVFAHNPAAWVGILLCVFLILLWFEQDAIRQRAKRDGNS